MPRLTAVAAHTRYRPVAGHPDESPHRQPLLTRPVDGDLLRQPYDEVITYATAFLGTAEAEAIRTRFMRHHLAHPPSQALVELGRAIKTIGGMLLLCSSSLWSLTFRENPYLSPAVRIQGDRGHAVVSTGPYRSVRHPMSAAFVAFVPGPALWLGSWYGVVVGLILVGMVAGRAVLEERTLRKGLKGDEVYMAQVKYRLIPHVW
jgi:protein-S-isoprenylcysteine O-methyltransferase Ste14